MNELLKDRQAGRQADIQTFLATKRLRATSWHKTTEILLKDKQTGAQDSQEEEKLGCLVMYGHMSELLQYCQTKVMWIQGCRSSFNAHTQRAAAC